MKFENTRVMGIENAIIGMRLPLNLSFDEALDKCDSAGDVLGANDKKLAARLAKADSIYSSQPNSKFMRMIHVQVCITAPMYWAAELDTYKVGTVRDSSSMQHKGASRPYTLDDFEIDNREEVRRGLELGLTDDVITNYWRETLKTLNLLREQYNLSKDYQVFRQLRQILPSSYNYTFMFDCNYAVLRTMIEQRKNHRLKEWSVHFMEWCRTLPYAAELLFIEEK